MNTILKDIVPAGISYRKGEFDLNTMTVSLPGGLKKRIIDYLNTPPAGLVGDVRLIDPVTGKCYSNTSVIREQDGFEWSTADIYMLENYDVKLSDEFLILFQ